MLEHIFSVELIVFKVQECHVYINVQNFSHSTFLKTVRGSNPGGGEIFAHIQTGPEAHPASCTMGTGSFPGVKQPGVVLTTHPLLVPRLRKSRTIPLLTL
jgi:hypothetical protein